MHKWGQARLAFSALWPEIKSRLECGETRGQVFENLRDSGRITMGKATFYRHLRQHLGRATPGVPRQVALPAPPAGAASSSKRTNQRAAQAAAQAPRVVQPELQRLQPAKPRDPWADDEDDAGAADTSSEPKGDA